MSARNKKTAIAKLDALKAAPTLVDFAAWLAASQQRALDAMNATTGDTFGQHCDRFTALTTVINVVREFQQAAALQSSAKYAEGEEGGQP